MTKSTHFQEKRKHEERKTELKLSTANNATQNERGGMPNEKYGEQLDIKPIRDEIEKLNYDDAKHLY